MAKKLYRSNEAKMLAGVLGGIAEYFKIDATIVRLVYVILWIFTAAFPMTILYIAAAMIIPESDVYNK